MDEIDLVTSLLPAAEQQLNSPDTPFVKETYDRLLKTENLESDEIMNMIALCLADESNRVFIDQRAFDLERYNSLLKNLPSLPEA